MSSREGAYKDYVPFRIGSGRKMTNNPSLQDQAKGIVLEALTKLGGRESYKSGAKLAREIRSLSRERNFDFTKWLRSEGYTLRTLLESMGGDGVDVERRIGSDMLVGFSGAVKQEVVQSRIAPLEKPLRTDLYIALTRLSPSPYYYAPSRDAFTRRTIPGEASIEFPPPTLAELIETRRSFLDSLSVTLETKIDLQSALDNSGTPLRDFSNKLRELDLDREWERYNRSHLLERLTRWATENNVAVRANWFGEQEVAARYSVRQILAQLTDVLTEDEARDLRIPLSAVERLLSAFRM